MKKTYSFPLICFGIFLINWMLIKTEVPLPAFFTSYLNDLLCLPVVLGGCLFLIRSFGKNKKIKIPLFTAFSLAAFYGVYFELYLPEVKPRYTADVFDALLYFAGAFAFYLFQNLTFSVKFRRRPKSQRTS